MSCQGSCSRLPAQAAHPGLKHAKGGCSYTHIILKTCERLVWCTCVRDSSVKLGASLTCSPWRLFLTAVLLILRRAGSSICSSSPARAFTARDRSASTLELELDGGTTVAAVLGAAEPPAALALLLFDGSLCALLAISATPTIIVSWCIAVSC